MVGWSLYFPTLQGVHVLAPGRLSVFVTAPATHATQGDLGLAEYFPAPHAEQVVAPGSSPVLVTEPGVHCTQAPPLGEYSGAHAHTLCLVLPHAQQFVDAFELLNSDGNGE